MTRSIRVGRDHVESGHRLVEHQNVCVLRQALRDEDALALATGHLRQVATAQIGDLETVRRQGDCIAISLAHRSEGSERRCTGEPDHLVGRDQQMLGGMLRLQDVGDVPAHAIGWAAGNRHLSPARREQPGDRMEQRRLARAVRADHRGDATRDVQ
jgi:hypothetical protein